MGKKYSTPLYTPAIVVAHGQSEQLLSKHISSCLRLLVPVHHRTTSIQINGLLHELKTNFENVTQL